MSVASKNPFTLLEDDAPDAVDTPQQAPAETPQQPSKARSDQRNRGGPASRGGRYYNRGGKTAPAGDSNAQEEEGEPRKKNNGDSPRGRGRGRGGGRGGRGGARRGREHDRQSGTLPDSDKRVHQGWGGDDGDRELKNEQQAVADASAEASPAVAGDEWGSPAPVADDWAGTANNAADDWATPTDGATANKDATETTNTAPAKDDGEYRRRRAQEEEEEDNTLTLEQYLAQQKNASAVPKLEGTRKANEGSDDTLWKNATETAKQEEENYFIGKGKAAPKSRAKKAEKEFIEIDAHFERPNRGGRGRGGRGGDRGDRGGRGRGRGGDRYSNRNNNNSANGAVDVADQSAFPSLS